MRLINTLLRDRSGTSVIEFAILLPVLAAFLYGMLAYGQYFLIAHSVQELANDAARATIGGSNSDERRTLAMNSVTDELPRLNAMPANKVNTVVEDTNGLVTIRVRFDASAIGLFKTPLVPLPDPQIERRAVIRAGGIS